MELRSTRMYIAMSRALIASVIGALTAKATFSPDLRGMLRDHPANDAPLRTAIREAIQRKPLGHDFRIGERGAAPALSRPMSMTGG